MPRCPWCQKNKDIDSFYKDNSKNRGFRFPCKDCFKLKREDQKKNKTWRFSAEAKAKKSAYNKMRYQENIESEKERCRIRANRVYNETKYTIKTRLKVVYNDAKRRCTNPKDKAYVRYWWRGIKFLRDSFDEFYADMSEGYIQHINEYGMGTKYTQLDRIDNDWNYCKENCRRITAKENNHRNRKKQFYHK